MTMFDRPVTFTNCVKSRRAFGTAGCASSAMGRWDTCVGRWCGTFARRTLSHDLQSTVHFVLFLACHLASRPADAHGLISADMSVPVRQADSSRVIQICLCLATRYSLVLKQTRRRSRKFRSDVVSFSSLDGRCTGSSHGNGTIL